VLLGSWVVINDTETKTLENFLSDWDPAVSLTAAIPVTIDVQGVLDDCGLAADARMRLVTAWKSSGTFLRGCGEAVDLVSSTPYHEMFIKVNVQGIKLAESLELSLQLLLLHPGSNTGNPFAPYLPGSVLAKSPPHRVLLEGYGARFPVEVIDFTNTRFPTDAGWCLYWEPSDLYQSVMANVRLYINSRHERVKRAVSEDRPEDFDIRDAIRYDVARTLIHGALAVDEFVDHPESYEPGTIGRAVKNMIRMYFQQIDFRELRSNSKSEDFDAILQEKLHLFWQEA